MNSCQVAEEAAYLYIRAQIDLNRFWKSDARSVCSRFRQAWNGTRHHNDDPEAGTWSALRTVLTLNENDYAS